MSNIKCLKIVFVLLFCVFVFPSAVIGLDRDMDGIDDAFEDQLLATYAPVVMMDEDDWTKPANVDWFVARASLRFHHDGGCTDCLVESSPTQLSSINWSHNKKRGTLDCSHYNDPVRSDGVNSSFDTGQCFFLQVGNNDHSGSSNPSDWKVYGHVYPNRFGGINIQYWFFYAYNDGLLGFNHEGDWECIIVQLNPDNSVKDLLYFQHDENDPPPLSSSQVSWYNSTHPVVYAARGSHASYHSPSAANAPINDSWTGCSASVDSCANAWYTWTGGKPQGAPGNQGGGVLNVGEKNSAHTFYFHSQHFLVFFGRWGEIGLHPDIGTSGPRGPAYQTKWNKNYQTSSNLDFVYVDDDYNSSTDGWGYDRFDNLYDGLFNVKTGGTVYVYAGTYYEKILIDKSLSLIGVDGKEVTFIDGNNQSGSPVIKLDADYITISGFTIQNGSAGIEFYQSNYSTITENTIKNFTWGLILEWDSGNNEFYYNNFMNNTYYNAVAEYGGPNSWYLGVLGIGNYWDDYSGSDSDGDGIGDSTYTIYSPDNIDSFPVISPNGWKQVIDPGLSSLEVQHQSTPGLFTCPAGDGSVYQYLVLKVRNVFGEPIANIPAGSISLSPVATAGAQYYGTLSFSITPVDSVSDANGNIRFQVKANTSIQGGINFKTSFRGVDVVTAVPLSCNSADINTDGVVNLSDLGLFSSVLYGTYDVSCDYNFDGVINLSDGGYIATHNGHSH